MLKRKVKEGVAVRILFDSMGCRTMKNRDWERLERAGIEVAEFFPALLGNLQLRINYRNHRKIVVIDGRIGFVGGFNVGREYIGLDEKFGYWRDTHLRIEGRRSHLWRCGSYWTGIMRQKKICFWTTSCLKYPTMYGTGMIRYRSFPVDRTHRSR